MVLLQEYFSRVTGFFDGYLPLKNPVLILAITLLIILAAPLLFRRFRIPGIIGLIIAGIVIGPHSFHIIESTNSFELFSKTGLLYIMFLAGLEIDMHEFRHNRNKSIVFGIFTFTIPIVIGYFVCIYIFHFSFWPALLLASMFSTHTLLSYPIVSNMGVVKNRAVQVAFGGTIITDSAVLILLGIITKFVTGGMDNLFWFKITVSLSLLLFSTVYLLPRVSRWFFRNIEAQAGSHYIFVLAVVFTSGFFSELAGVEPIIGAFLAGLGLNRVIPHNGILMNRIIFIGNTLFIPFFLISAGMLVDLRLFFTGLNALGFAGILCVVGLLTKYLSAYITALIYRYNKFERNVLFGLTVSHAAATLAIIKVGFDLGLFDQNVINATILLILFSCLAGTFVTERAARGIAILEKEVVRRVHERPERILIPVSNPDNIQRLIDLALVLKDNHSSEPLYPLSIVEDDADADEKINLVRKVIEGAAEQIASGDKKVEVLKKVDLSIVDGIVRTAKAYNITDILISYRQHGPVNIFSSVSLNLLAKCRQAVIVSKILQPLTTFHKITVVLSPNSELENGFGRAAQRIGCIMRQIGSGSEIYGTQATLDALATLLGDKRKNVFSYKPVTGLEHFEPVNQVREDQLFVFLSARPQTISFDYHVEEMPRKLSRNHEFTSFIIFYPDMSKVIADPGMTDFTTAGIGQQYVKVKQFTGKITGIFKKEGEEEGEADPNNF
jgi:Kef-type K+ transport system membrane component KefB